MRIFFSENGSDPMLLDTEAGLKALHDDLAVFLASSVVAADFPAVTEGNAAPYCAFLAGLRLVKCEGDLSLALSPDRWLILSGSSGKLDDVLAKFLVTEEQGHKHLYAAPLSLIIEADSAYEPSAR